MIRRSTDGSIPEAARPIIEKLHRRYRAACRRGVRPCLTDPRAVGALLTARERVVLASQGYYPVPPSVIRLGMTRAEHRRQEILDIVAAELPDAVMTVLETTEA